MIRKRCVQRGHKWRTFSGVTLPFQFCNRALCDGSRVNPDYPMPDDVRAAFEQVVLENLRARIKEER